MKSIAPSNGIYLGLSCAIASLVSFSIPLSIDLAASAQTVQTTNIIPLEPVRPSLWWMVQRLEDGWVDDLAIDPDAKRVVITVNRSRWFAADYIRRYEFLYKLGNTAQEDAYGVLLKDNRNNKLAEYIVINDRWQMEPKSLGAVPFRVNSPNPYQTR
ncbi:hypothetical protein V2H45_05575 [Tumidithrix elongata RA019]|uniref:Uncharacterized protein n=1 Tax=Tumidithrix elongata BACA0141 TaxID=2716417 RepID=A0AAW9PR10_9CYAN|nr:hypothetical protein [Tumidithrix elongata RA019]